MNPANATYIGDTYLFNWPEEGVEITLDRIHESKVGIGGRISVRSAIFGKLHSPSNFNCTSQAPRQALARALSERDAGIDWGAAIEQVCELTQQRWEEGEPLIDLSEAEPSTTSRWAYEPWIETGGPTILFADGGVGKSVFALAIATALTTGTPILGGTVLGEPGPVLYLDWETSWQVHSERLRALCLAEDLQLPHIYYQSMTASFAESASAIRKKIAQHGIRYVVVDSLGAARGGEPESAETTIRLFNAGRTLGVPWLGIDHVTKNGGDKTRPFGSTYTHNLARLTWSMERAQEEGEDATSIVLTNHKSNNGRLSYRRGYKVDFMLGDTDELVEIVIQPQDIRDMPAMRKKLRRQDQIFAAMREMNRAATAEDIEGILKDDGIDLNLATIRATLHRYKDLFVPITEGGRIVSWGILSKYS